MEGYQNALLAHGISVDNELVVECSHDLDKNIQILKQAISKLKPDGVFSSFERFALAAYYSCAQKDIIIGKDIKIISFSCMEIAGLLKPSLSTVNQPAYEMGSAAAKLLLQQIETFKERQPTSFQHVVLNSTLTIRESSSGKKQNPEF